MRRIPHERSRVRLAVAIGLVSVLVLGLGGLWLLRQTETRTGTETESSTEAPERPPALSSPSTDGASEAVHHRAHDPEPERGELETGEATAPGAATTQTAAGPCCEGRVLTLGGAPIPDASVEFRSVHGVSPTAWSSEVRTGADGSFSLSGDAPPPWIVRARHPRNVGRAVQWAGDEEPLEFRLLPADHVFGRVLDDDGTACRIRELFVLRERDGGRWQRVLEPGASQFRVDEQGHFTLALTSLRGARVLAIAEDGAWAFGGAEVLREAPPEGPFGPVELRVAPRSPLQVRLADDDGNPWPGASLQLVLREGPEGSAHDSGFRLTTLTSDAQGRITALLPAGRLSLRASAPGALEEREHRIELPTENEVEIRLRRGRLLEGRIAGLGPGHRPALRLRWNPEDPDEAEGATRSTRLDPARDSYRLVLPRAARGSLALSFVDPAGQARDLGEWPLPLSSSTLQLEPRAPCIEGRLRLTGEAPSGSASVFVGTDANPRWLGATLDQDGLFQFQALGETPSRLSLVCGDLNEPFVVHVFDDAATELDLSIELQDIAGRVCDEQGTALPRANVQLLDGRTGTKVHASVVGDMQGRFRFRSVPDAEWQLRFSVRGHEVVQQPWMRSQPLSVRLPRTR